MWKLHHDPLAIRDPKDENQPVFSFGDRTIYISCLANKPDTKTTVFAVGTDKKIKEIDNGKLVDSAIAGVNISQIKLMHGARAFILGIAEEDKPGSIWVLRNP